MCTRSQTQIHAENSAPSFKICKRHLLIRRKRNHNADSRIPLPNSNFPLLVIPHRAPDRWQHARASQDFSRGRGNTRVRILHKNEKKGKINKKKWKRNGRGRKSGEHDTVAWFVPPLANPVSNEPLRRTGSYAAATITAALAIWAATGSSNVLQSLFLSLSYAVYRALRGHRWLTVHRKQLYQRLPLPPPLVQHQSPAPTFCRPRLLPRPSTTSPLVGLPSEKITGLCRTACQVYPNNTGTTIALERKYSNNKFYRQPGTSWPLEQRRRRRHLNALHPRRRRRRRRLRLRSSTRPSHRRLRRDVNVPSRPKVSGVCVNVPMRPPLPPPPPPHPRCRRLRRPRHLSRCWRLLTPASTHKRTASRLAAAPPARAWSRIAVTVNRRRREDATGAARPGSLWRATVTPPEVDASVDS